MRAPRWAVSGGATAFIERTSFEAARSRMSAPTYIVGHKNPDADAICSAIAYASFKEAIGQSGYTPVRCGNSNARIDAILSRFNVPLPAFVGDVTPRVQDIMRRNPFVISDTGTCAEALEILDTHDIRAIPVVNSTGHLKGQVSIFDLGEYFIPKMKSAKIMRRVYASVADIVRSLKGRILCASEPERIEELFVRVAAMDVHSFGTTRTALDIPAERSVIVVGDRVDIQRRAIEMAVRLIVVTGDLPVSPEIVAFAQAAGVCIASSPLDSASSAWIIRAASPVAQVSSKAQSIFSPSEKLSSVKRKLAASPALLNCVVDEDGRLLGVFTKSDLLKPVKTRLVLVDHNELSQAVDGAAEVNIAEVIDHHRLGNPPTHSPILFVNRPIGSTCSIIADMYRMYGLTPPPSIAGLMMSGLISDTLLLQSPTATPVDAELLEWLSGIAGIAPKALAELIFSAGSVLSSGSPLAAVKSDCKHYDESGRSFSVSGVEEIAGSVFWEKADALLAALETYRAEHDLYFSCLLVTDIDTQNSVLLVKGHPDFLASVTYPLKREEIFDMPGIVSRKKQLVAYLTDLLAPVK